MQIAGDTFLALIRRRLPVVVLGTRLRVLIKVWICGAELFFDDTNIVCAIKIL